MDKGPEKAFLKRYTSSQQVSENVFNIAAIREIQMTTVIRQNLTSARMPGDRNIDNNKYQVRGDLAHCC